ncbi:hypothetical protein D3C71_1542450 [compost metagenome]
MPLGMCQSQVPSCAESRARSRRSWLSFRACSARLRSVVSTKVLMRKVTPSSSMPWVHRMPSCTLPLVARNCTSRINGPLLARVDSST